MARSHDLVETLQNVVELVAERLDADVCSVYLSEPDGRRLTLRATKGLDPAAVGRVQLAVGEGLVGVVAKRREPLALDRAQEHPEFRYFPETGEERYSSLLAAPLLMREMPIGVLAVQTVKPRRFGAADVQLLQALGHVLAPVVLNAMLLGLVAAPPEERGRFERDLARAGIPLSDPDGRPARSEENFELRGTSASTGIAIGRVYLLEDPLDLSRVEYRSSGDPAAERVALQDAVAAARGELAELIDEVGAKFGAEFASVFNTHVQILEDKGFLARLEAATQDTADAFQAVRRVCDEYRALFQRIEDPYFRDRGVDIEDVGRRLISKLLGVSLQNAPLEPDSIVITSMILPAHFTTLETDRVGAVVAEHGGVTSHGAIFARTLEIPAVMGVEGLTRLVRPGETAIVDGTSGRIYLSPDEALLREYRRAKQRFAITVEHLDALRHRPSETRDGRHIALSANVGLLADLRLVERHGAEGVGLFRTELLALAHRGIPEEAEQQKLYEQVAQTMAPRPVTIRTLDLGGDKAMPSLGIPQEENPQLGCRSIRLSLRDESMLRTQIRAILRASTVGNLRLLLPMISSLDELRRARAVIAGVQEDLAASGIDFDEEMPLGVMVEVPSAALIADALARECDFFSIGTNDLTQYVLAVDRGNEAIAHLYRPLHPAVLTLIARSAQAAQRAGISVSVCGEIASNPLAVPLLVGLGIGELSGTPRAVPVVKEIVRALDSAEAAGDARRALSVGTAAEVEAIASRRLEATGLLDHPDIGEWLTSMVERVRSRA